MRNPIWDTRFGDCGYNKRHWYSVVAKRFIIHESAASILSSRRVGRELLGAPDDLFGVVLDCRGKSGKKRRSDLRRSQGLGRSLLRWARRRSRQAQARPLLAKGSER